MKLAKLKKLADRMHALAQEAEEEAQDLRDTWEGRSEKWQESERGAEQEDRIYDIELATSGVVNEIETLIEHLDG